MSHNYEGHQKKGFNQAVGARGEQTARGFLEKKGFRFLEANFRTRWGEIDLIMEDKNVLVFVEVKFRQNDQYGEPEEAVGRQKSNRIIRSALTYLQKKRCQEKYIRFDVVSIGANGIRTYSDAFQVDSQFYY